jgi:hypothetical protein
MNKLVARDFEDLLQVPELSCPLFHQLTSMKCAIPVFEGFLPEVHNKIIMNLLFKMATWYFLAKLRPHTESTLTALETSTTRLGAAFRRFICITCEAYVMKDLPSEEAARGRCQAVLSQKKGTSGKVWESTKKKGKSSSKHKYNLQAYKPHAIPDYVSYIHLYGTTDGFTTQVVSNLSLNSINECLTQT